MDVLAGLVVLLVGASAAGTATRRLPEVDRGRWVVPALIGSGALIGGGAALVRGWDLAGTVLAGAVVVPLVTIGFRLVETRRRGDAT